MFFPQKKLSGQNGQEEEKSFLKKKQNSRVCGSINIKLLNKFRFRRSSESFSDKKLKCS